jgi:hypothetical protein
MNQHQWTLPEVREAVELRRRGMSYPAISHALGHYRGITVTANAVRDVCITRGCPTNPRMHANPANLRQHQTA